jgi:4-cresol dehydrogenase (hydroxylating)
MSTRRDDREGVDLGERLRTALAAWTELLGPAHVLVDPAVLARYGSTTLPAADRPVAAVLRPDTRDGVAACVRIAGKYKVPLYPVSTGRNWGYGDACPPTPGQVIIDLSRMNRVVELDPRLAYVVIEPGVTQGQLAQLLAEQRTGLWLDCTGAGPDVSIVGNVLERGFGHTAYGDRFRHVCGLEVVLADGNVLRTGFGHYGNARAARVFPYGIGPVLDGLFTQSNFGIVTQLGLWLMPKPRRSELFFCQIRDHADLAPAIDALRGLRLDGTLRSVVHIGNDLRLISSRPAGGIGAEQVPLTVAARKSVREGERIAAWSMSGSLTGSGAQVRAARAAVRRALRGPGRRLLFLGERKLRLAEFATRLLGGESGGKLRQLVAAARAVADLNTGRPTGHFLSGAYWRRRGGVPARFPAGLDPARDRCGLIWLSPVLPMIGAAALELHDSIEPIYQAHGFHPLITLSTINERALSAVMTVAYDKEDPGETQRARECYRALWDALAAAGFMPYRAGIQSMADLARNSTGFWPVTRRIKAALDPDGIIAPGRYDPLQFDD